MSYVDEVNTVPWVAKTYCRNSLTIVVLSVDAHIVENISEALIDIHNKHNHHWKLSVLRCTELDNIIQQSDITGKIGIDFIVIALDTSRMFCIDWMKKSLEQVHPALRIRRVVFVNSSGLSANMTAVNGSELISFCKENNLDIMTANTSNRHEAEFLAQRLLNYIEVSIGNRTGIPNLNV
ncbi:unnamed protein product [Leptosia nina]|uniref:Centromere protein M n=1 Tax=Leptosia nina TaxID=320188 RepID=A0AAV1J1B5_9NEOP